MDTKEFKAIFVFDIDGVLTEPNKKRVPRSVQACARESGALIAVASGKALGWCWAVGDQIGAHAVFGENSAIWQLRGEESVQLAEMEEIERLKQALCFTPIQNAPLPEALITIHGETSRVLFEPEKQILTLWATAVKGRWDSFPGSKWNEQVLIAKIQKIIEEEGLHIEIVGPHKDGGIDFHPSGLDKGKLVHILRALLPGLRIYVFVDGDNDIPLAKHPNTFAVTFANAAEKVRTIVEEKVTRGMGLILPQVGYAGGVQNALAILTAKRPSPPWQNIKTLQPYCELRPWGQFARFTQNTPCTLKILTVTPGEALSLQFHQKRDEFWHVLKGRAYITIGDTVFVGRRDDKFFIPRTVQHRIEATGKHTVQILEIALGEADEQDIVRVEDRYQRN